MKLVFAIILMLMVSSGFGQLIPNGLGQRKIKKIEVEETGVNYNISYRPEIDKTKVNGLDVMIRPISGDELNIFFNDLRRLNGKFNYSFFNKSIESYFCPRSVLSPHRFCPPSPFVFFTNKAIVLTSS
jgi:hypothetical protein